MLKKEGVHNNIMFKNNEQNLIMNSFEWLSI